jgi:hypothetical protein
VIGYYLFILYLFLPYYSIGCFFFKTPDTGGTCVKKKSRKGEVFFPPLGEVIHNLQNNCWGISFPTNNSYFVIDRDLKKILLLFLSFPFSSEANGQRH